MSPAIKVENLSKHYLLGLTHSGSIRELVNGAASRLFRRRPGQFTQNKASRVDGNGNFWALKDINFEINAGEVVGIIGRNGAGKSTLLKILSRITLPSSGRIEMRGRVASLLEVGTGFHPELTGRENVYMNGTILGMTKHEIARRFDAIVDFAGVETFIDTPVKRYSSGMTVRLGFAVAAHLDPEILIVDEVLAVGDAVFQKKCLGRMRASAEEGRTVLFVSHQLPAVESLTRSCLLLEDGEVKGLGETSAIIRRYLLGANQQSHPEFSNWPEQHVEGDLARLTGLAIKTVSNKIDNFISYGQEFTIQLDVDFTEPLTADVAMVIENADRKPILSSHLSDTQQTITRHGKATFSIRVNPNQLKPGDYLITTSISSLKGEVAHAILHYPSFSVRAPVDYDGPPMEKRWGDLVTPYSWIVE